MKTRSAGPSGPLKSTAGDSRANPRDGWLTAAERQCGMAKPPGIPVGLWASRPRASWARPSASARPAAAMIPATEVMTSAFVDPRSASRRTSSGVMRGTFIGSPISQVDEADVDGVGLGRGRHGRSRQGCGGRAPGNGGAQTGFGLVASGVGQQETGQGGVPGSDG